MNIYRNIIETLINFWDVQLSLKSNKKFDDLSGKSWPTFYADEFLNMCSASRINNEFSKMKVKYV